VGTQLGVVGKKRKKMQNILYNFGRKRGGLKPCEGEKGEGKPRGERGASGSKQTFIRLWLELVESLLI
jgi:hypothetical protein